MNHDTLSVNLITCEYLLIQTSSLENIVYNILRALLLLTKIAG